MKKQMKRNRRIIYDNIRTLYQETGKELLKKNPENMDKLHNVILVCAILLLVSSVLSIFIQNIVTMVFLLVVFVVFIILALRNRKMEKQMKNFLEEKAEQIKEVCKMCIKDEADKYGIKPEELALYLRCNYTLPKWIKWIRVFISVIFTGLAVQYLPGFDQVEQGIFTFAILVGANLAISWVGSYINAKFEEVDSFAFYIINPYSDLFAEIDEKLK